MNLAIPMQQADPQIPRHCPTRGFFPYLAFILIAFAVVIPSYTLTGGATPVKHHTYYLSPAGDDLGPGTQQQPWRSPGKACRRISVGDTLIFLPGRYRLRDYGSDILRPPSGRQGAPITIKGANGKSRAVLCGGDNLGMAIDLAGTRHVRIENIEITSDPEAGGQQRWFREGISAVGAPTGDISLRNLYIHHLDEFGIDLQDVDGLTITDCRIEYCGFGAIGGPEGDEGGWRGVVVEGCRLAYGGHYYQGGNGSDRPYDRPDGIGLEPSEGPVEIRNTTAEHNYGDGIDLKPARATVTSCVVANNSCDGVKLWGDGSRVENTLIYGTGDGVGGPSPWAGIVIGTTKSNAEFEIVNVTLHDNPSRQAYPIYVQYDDRDVPIKVTMRNCIIAGGYGVAYFGPSVSLTAEHNLFYRPGDDVQIVVGDAAFGRGNLGLLGQGNIFGDPRFIRTAWGERGDYQLRKNSPAVDGGSSLNAAAADIDGAGRSAGAGVDIGAYERRRGIRPIRRPGAFTAEIVSNSVKLRWQDRSSDEEGFLIECKDPEQSGWLLLEFTDQDAESYSFKISSSASERFFRVVAVAGSRSSRSSRIAKLKTQD
jgi:hypothetical protein